VAEWLRAHLPRPWIVKAQEIVMLDSAGRYRFKPDLVIYNAETNQVRCVLDTKYKVPDQPAHADIAQVIAYAFMKQAPERVLVYPAPLAMPLDTWNHGIRARSAAFNLDGDLEEAGRAFLDEIGLTEACLSARAT
jgi:5-methylcytosine-specific restriction enzyme subunit McrC